jgi:predicted metal-dependent hydrolase
MTSVILNGLNVDLQWSDRRGTVGLSVTGEGKLRIAAPRGTSEERIAQVINRKRAWIERKIAQRRKALALLQNGVAFFLGRPYRLVVTPVGNKAVKLEADAIQVVGEKSDVWPKLQAWYRRKGKSIVVERVRDYADLLGLEVEQVELRDWRSRWGDCRPGGVLRFNWRAILLPSEVLDYLVVHELVHLLERRHNRRFWRFVATVLPDYASNRSWLQQYGTAFLIWEADT